MRTNTRRVVHLLACFSLLVTTFQSAPRSAGQAGRAPALAPQTGSPLAFGVCASIHDPPPDEVPVMPSDPDANAKSVPNRPLRSNVEQESGWSDSALSAPPSRWRPPGLEPPGTSPAPFAGLSNQDNFNAFGFRTLPSDSNGDVGPNHYVAQVNVLVPRLEQERDASDGAIQVEYALCPARGSLFDS